MEVLATRIRQGIRITGIEDEEYKMKSYVDNVVITVIKANVSLKYATEQIIRFGTYLGCKLSKKTKMLLEATKAEQVEKITEFIDTKKNPIIYLGIYVKE